VNVPILISLVRLVLTLPAAMAVFAGQWKLALAVAVIAGLSDAVDGWVARRWNQITRAGAWLDPIADKILLAALYIALGVAGAVPVWLVWLVFGRDLLIMAMAAFALAFTPFRDFPPSRWGKLSTVLQVAAVAAALAAQAWPSGGMQGTLAVLVWATAAGTVISGGHYFASGVRRWRNRARGSKLTA
jgi:cardiolipin synthase